MEKESLQFLTKLLETPSVSGCEARIQGVIKRRMQAFADGISHDVHGNLIVAVNPDAKIRVMLAGHCDQIGMMVSHITDAGYIYVKEIGGIDASVVPGSRVTIHAADGPIDGVIGYKPIHLIPPGERGKKVELSQLWIDIGPANGAEVKSRISIGDPITYKLGVERLGKHVISSPGCDNRVGAFVVMEALRLVSRMIGRKRNFPVGLFSVSTVQEEIGLRGAKTAAFTVDPLVGIAVDVTHASDNPGADAKEIGSVKLGGGPTIARGPNINPMLETLLVKTAKRKKLKFQPLAAAGATGTDANAMQVSRGGVAAALIGIPNRYMHTQVEVVDLRDIETAVKLLAETVMSITSRMDFVPR